MEKNILVTPNSFQPEKHWYAKSLNAAIHPIVSFFMNLSPERIALRYSHLHPNVDIDTLREILAYQPKHFVWAGTDLMHTVDAHGRNKMVVIETNSCPSGQKSFPTLNEHEEQGGYKIFAQETLLPLIDKVKKDQGAVAVLYDKNPIENFGYAAALADLLDEPIYCVEYEEDAVNAQVRIEKDQRLSVKSDSGEWIPLRAAFRYLTERPWNRLPLFSPTKIINPLICCLAGGRNKLVAAKAYDLLNAELTGSGLSIQTPKTIWDVRKNEVRLWVKYFGNKAVVKVPYGHAGQGIFTIINEQELDDFMKLDFPYEAFIVQSLIGNYEWSSVYERERLYHTGTIPNKDGESYVFDIRMMINSTKQGFRPLAIYSRRTELPLAEKISESSKSRDMLVTNLSYLNEKGDWDTDVSRLLLMDRKDFNRLGISLDDLIEGYIQTVLATIAIDKMSQNLISTKKTFKKKRFTSLNNDAVLLSEIYGIS